MPWNKVFTFSDPLQCHTQSGAVEVFPTARGTFRAGSAQIGLNRLWIARHQWTLPQVVTFVVKPDRRSITFLVESTSTTLQHRGVEVSPRDIAVDDTHVTHYRCNANLCAGGMSLPVDEIGAASETTVGRNFPKKLQAHVIRPSSALMSRLLQLPKMVGQLAHDTPDIFEQAEVRRALEEQLIHLMVRCLAEGVGIETTTGARRHDAIVARFDEFWRRILTDRSILQKYARASASQSAPFRAACEEHLGM